MTVRLSRKYGFAASHRLHSPALSDEENRRAYGKCNNPHGHGHNYEVEITVRGEVDRITGRAVDLRRLDRIAEEQILKPLRYRNLNEEVPVFREVVPTTENLAAELDRRLRSAWPEVFPEGGPVLEKLRIWETERNICEIDHAWKTSRGS
jgi:6-pyruvoyltetrahydropterin/6-carboxytetrahydropterin synthase